MKRLPIGLIAVSVLSFVILCGLGFWQTERLAWKTGLIEDIETKRSAPPIRLAEAMTRVERGESIEFVNVEAQGRFSPGKSFFVIDSLDGKPGWTVISPLRTEDGLTVLVDRGLIPDAARAGFVTGGDDVLVLTGQVSRHADARGAFTPENDVARNTWFWRDIPAMLGAADLPADALAAPFILHAMTDTGPRPRPLTANLRNNHLGYAITWFGLAATLAVIAFLLVRRRMRG